MSSIERVELFIAVAFLQYADFVTTWLFSQVGVPEGNKLMAYHDGGAMLHRIIFIKCFCILVAANMFLRKRNEMSWGNRSVQYVLAKTTKGRVVLRQHHFYNAFVAWMLLIISWNLLAAFVSV